MRFTIRALVIGGNGFIGSHLVDELVVKKWSIRILDLFDRRFGTLPTNVEFIRGDMTNSSTIHKALEGVDLVFHLAWMSIPAVAANDPLGDISDNLIATVKLITDCCKTGVKRIIFLSSGGTVYGIARELPIDEQHPTEPINPYGITKLAVEKYLKMYHHLYGLDYVILRPSVTYGPGQDPTRKQGAVNAFLYRAKKGEPIEIWGDGSIVRDYFYIEDMISAIVLSAITEKLKNIRVFNIGGGQGYSLNELVEVIEQVTKRRVAVEYQLDRIFDVPSVVLDTSRAERCLGWRPKVKLSEGVAQTWDWIQGLNNLNRLLR